MKRLGQKYLGILLLVFMVLSASLCVSAVGIVNKDTNSTDIVMGNNTKNDTSTNITNYTDVIFVSVDGNDNNNGTSELESKRTIQNAINKESKKNTIIIVKPGVYYENIRILKNRNIIFKGENATINGNARNRCINISGGANVELYGFTITNGSTKYYGGGISNQGNLTVENCRITGNHANDGGGISSTPEIGQLAPKLIIKDSIIQNNSAYCGSGIYNVGILTIERSIIKDNKADSIGGGIYTYNVINFYNSTIIGNQASNGGGIYSNEGEIYGFNVTIKCNNATNGGGVYSLNDRKIENCTIENNSAVNGGGLYAEKLGGGLSAKIIPRKVFNCIFKDNTANNSGGGAFLNFGYTFVACVFDHNSATAYGGAINSSKKKILTISNCVFTDNIASKGGAIALKGELKHYYSSKFTNNQAPDIYIIT